MTMTPPGRVRGRLDRPAAARDRVPARRGRRAAHPRPVRLARLLQARPRGHRPRRRRLVPHGRPRRGRSGRPLPDHRPEEGDLQEPAGPDDRAPAGREPVPRLRGGLAGVPRRRSPRVQHAPRLAEPRVAAGGGAFPGGGARAHLVARREREPLPRAVRAGGRVPDPPARARRRARRAHPQVHLQAGGRREELEGRSSRRCTSRSTSRSRSTAPSCASRTGSCARWAILQHEVSLRDGVLRAGERTLRVGPTPEAPGATRIGDLAYATGGTVFDLGALLSRPSLWLGNEALRRFVGDEAFVSLVSRRRKGGGDVRIDPRLWTPPPPERIWELLRVMDERADDALDPRRRRAAPRRAPRGAPRARPPPRRPALGPAGPGGPLPRPAAAGGGRAGRGHPPARVPRCSSRTRSPAETLETLRRFLDRMGPFALRDDDLVDAARARDHRRPGERPPRAPRLRRRAAHAARPVRPAARGRGDAARLRDGDRPPAAVRRRARSRSRG